MPSFPMIPQLVPFTFVSDGKEKTGEILLTPAQVKNLLACGEFINQVESDLVVFGGMTIERAEELAQVMGVRIITVEDFLLRFFEE